jgi:hypothetical protein
MTEHPVTVLYIAGLGRSGSTLIGTMLHNVNGFACLGELQLVWLRGLIQNQPSHLRRPARAGRGGLSAVPRRP